MITWHYTTGHLLDAILADEEIRPTTVGVETGDLDEQTVTALERIVATGKAEGVAIPFKERPAVWFSNRETWEPTASKGIVDARTSIKRTATIAEMIELGGGLARIGIEAEGLATWFQHRKTSGMSPATARALVQAAVKVGANPGDWLVHYGAVPSSKWRAAQRWDGAQWIGVDVQARGS